ncbi:MAG: hypothetical protein C0511_06350 [Hyphomicrobium sp.]|nr:hypothetical protein [Hyphomicrobium sp.]
MGELKKVADLERAALPMTMLDAWHRMFGRDADGIPALRSFAKKKRWIRAMNEELRKRGCREVDIDTPM